jgi:hypothetical protein
LCLKTFKNLSKNACQAPKEGKQQKLNKIAIAKQLWPASYNRNRNQGNGHFPIESIIYA